MDVKAFARDQWAWVCLAFSILNLINGLWMLIDPTHWYYNLPVGVPEYGPLNVHFIRDIGCSFFVFGCGLMFATFNVALRVPLFTMNTAFLIMHMFVHILEISSRRIPLKMIWVELPGVYIPAIVALVLNIILFRKSTNASGTVKFSHISFGRVK